MTKTIFVDLILVTTIFVLVEGCRESPQQNQNNTFLDTLLACQDFEEVSLDSLQHNKMLPDETPTLSSLGQFKVCPLPYSSKDLFFSTLKGEFHFPSIDVFEDRNFSFYHVPALQKDSIWPRPPRNYYTEKLFHGDRFELLFLQRQELEPGYLEPIVMCFVLDGEDYGIHDSMLVHATYAWENSFKIRFLLDIDSVLTVSEYESFDPSYGLPDSGSSRHTLVETSKVKHYRVSRRLKFQQVYPKGKTINQWH